MNCYRTHCLCGRCTPGCGIFDVPSCVALLNAANARSVAPLMDEALSTLSTPVLSPLSKWAPSARKISTGKAASGISVLYSQRLSIPHCISLPGFFSLKRIGLVLQSEPERTAFRHPFPGTGSSPHHRACVQIGTDRLLVRSASHEEASAEAAKMLTPQGTGYETQSAHLEPRRPLSRVSRGSNNQAQW